MRKWLKDNGLVLALTALFIASLAGQIVFGFRSNNEDLVKHHAEALSFFEYLASGHFIEATFENWESEFLQMALYVILTAALYQRGSAESNAGGKPRTCGER